jgi:hypothetical protein
MDETIETILAEESGENAIKDIIVIKQLPVMEQRFQEISEEIKNRLMALNGLEVSEDTKTQAKRTLAEFRKDFDAFEERRKQVKAEINRPYDELNELYRTYIENPYKEAFSNISAKIAEIEGQQKDRMREEALSYYNEYMAGTGLAFPEYDQGRFAANLSTTMKSLKEQIRKYLDGVRRDVESIGTFENADDIMVEYKATLDLPGSIKAISDRARAKAQIEAEKARMAEAAEQARMAEAKVDAAIAKAEEAQEIRPAQEIAQPKAPATKKMQFWALVDEEKFNKLVKFMKEEGYEYGIHRANADGGRREHAGA